MACRLGILFLPPLIVIIFRIPFLFFRGVVEREKTDPFRKRNCVFLLLNSWTALFCCFFVRLFIYIVLCNAYGIKACGRNGIISANNFFFLLLNCPTHQLKYYRGFAIFFGSVLATSYKSK